MIVYGGLLYLLGETVGSASKGKDYIQDALIGLFILFSAVAILRVVGVEQGLRPLLVPRVKPDPFTYLGGNQDAPVSLGDIGIQPRSKSVDPDDIQPEGPRTGNPAGIDLSGLQKNKMDKRPTGNRNDEKEKGGLYSVSDDHFVGPKSTALFPTDLAIPRICSGRSASADAGPIKLAGLVDVDTTDFAICHGGKCLDEAIIGKYLQEQARTGVPAGALMAQIFVEAGPCAVLHLFDDLSVCGISFNNPSGIACPSGLLPKETCPAPAFRTGTFISGEVAQKMEGTCEETDKLPVGNLGPKMYNDALQGNDLCSSICKENLSAGLYQPKADCGSGCFPQITVATTYPGDKNGSQAWYQSVSCQRKFADSDDFLQHHLGAVKACLPYNDSVYHFAYCLAVSSYTGSTGLKGAAMAQVIRRNCLCDKIHDKSRSLCDLNNITIENVDFERRVAETVIQKASAYRFPKKCTDCDAQGRCLKYENFGGPDYTGIMKALKEKPGLDKKTYFPNDDIGITRKKM
jgi:hypothetical protein